MHWQGVVCYLRPICEQLDWILEDRQDGWSRGSNEEYRNIF